MSDIKKKISSIDKKISVIDEKMKTLLMQKKSLLQQKKEITEQEILDVVKNNGASAETLSSDLALVKILKENNLTKEDILELVSVSNSESLEVIKWKYQKKLQQ